MMGSSFEDLEVRKNSAGYRYVAQFIEKTVNRQL